MNRIEFSDKFATADISKFNDKVLDDILIRNMMYNRTEVFKVITIEECSELIKEITKDLRGNPDILGIVEEMADVCICIHYLMFLYDISMETVTKAMKVKADRIEQKTKEARDSKWSS